MTPLRIAAALAAALVWTTPTAARADESRLPTDVAPTFEAIHLNLDADKEDYSGTVRIQITVRQATSTIRFHAQEMELKRLELQGAGGTVALSAGPEEKGIVTARPAGPRWAGRHSRATALGTEFGRR